MKPEASAIATLDHPRAAESPTLACGPNNYEVEMEAKMAAGRESAQRDSGTILQAFDCSSGHFCSTPLSARLGALFSGRWAGSMMTTGKRVKQEAGLFVASSGRNA